MDSLSLPLDIAAIERILPHRFPFLLVDRVIELEPDRRIVGIKNISLNDRYLSRTPGERPSLPPTILIECVAQVSWPILLRSRFTRASMTTTSPAYTGRR